MGSAVKASSREITLDPEQETAVSAAEHDQFAQRLEQEMYEFRLTVLGRVCAARGIRATRDDCAAALEEGEGRLSLAVAHLSKSWHASWSAQRVMSVIRRVLGMKN